jgi:hypothetical protein
MIMRRVAFVVCAISDETLQGLDRDGTRIYTQLTDPEVGDCSSSSPSPLLGCQSRADFNNRLSSVVEDWKVADQLIFYFSGHGFIRGDQYCLRLGKTKSDAGLESFIPFNSFINDLKSYDIQKAILIIDACHSGAIVAGVKDLEDEFSPIKKDNIPKGIAIIASSRSTQKSHELKNGSNGVFTELLCKGLESGLDRNPTKNGLIAIDDIIQYINEKLNSEEYSSFSQRPVFSVDNADEKIWIAKNKSGKLPSNVPLPVNNYNYIQSTEELELLYSQTLRSQHPCIAANINDLDWEVIKQYFKKVSSDLYPEQDSEAILSSLKLYSPIPISGRKVLHKSAVGHLEKSPKCTKR